MVGILNEFLRMYNIFYVVLKHVFCVFIRDCYLSFDFYILFLYWYVLWMVSLATDIVLINSGIWVRIWNSETYIWNIGLKLGIVFTRSNNTKYVSHINVIKTLHDFTATWLWFCVFSYVWQETIFLRHMVDLIWCFTGFAR